MGGIPDDSDVGRLEFVNLLRIALVLLSEFRSAKGGQRIRGNDGFGSRCDSRLDPEDGAASESIANESAEHADHLYGSE